MNGLLDTLLDRSIVGGYSRIGYELRRAGWAALPRMDGQVVAVTGATSGLGLAAAAGFAGLGAQVWLLVRDAERGERAAAEVRARVGGAVVHVAICDLSSLASVRAFAAGFAGQAQRLDVLVQNAGVLTEQRRESVEGIELTYATNVVGPFLLTHELLALLRASAPARIITVSSGGMYARRLRVADLEPGGVAATGFSGTELYARTKRAEVVLSELWAGRLRGDGVVAHAMHPGWVDTPGLEASLPGFHRRLGPVLRTPEQGADTIVWLGAAPEPLRSTGGFWHDRRRRPVHLVPWTRESAAERDALWAACARLTGT